MPRLLKRLRRPARLSFLPFLSSLSTLIERERMSVRIRKLFIVCACVLLREMEREIERETTHRDDYAQAMVQKNLKIEKIIFQPFPLGPFRSASSSI